MARSLSIGLLALLLMGGSVVGETVRVSDAEGLRSALASASGGDVVELEPGRYETSIRIPDGVTLDGLDAAKAMLVGAEYAVIRMDGDRGRVRNLTLKGGSKTVRGVTGERSVAVERCVFEGLPEAVALRMAPLSDVICCTFTDCGIGVRAIGDASPTVWGCRFEGGRIGLFAMGGAPFVVNNLFRNVETGILLAYDSPHPRVVRHNVFVDCRKSGIELKPDSAMPVASVRNCIFVRCPTAITGEAALLSGVSHCALEACGDMPLDATKHFLSTDPVGLAIDAQGTVTTTADLATAGVRWTSEEPGTTHPIGLDEGLTRPGAAPNDGITAPTPRFLGAPFIANAVSEEYLYLSMLGLRMGGQGIGKVDGRMADTIHAQTRDGTQKKMVFIVDRFYGEWAMPISP